MMEPIDRASDKKRQWAWFVFLWLAGIAAVSGIAVVIKLLFHLLGLT